MYSIPQSIGLDPLPPDDEGRAVGVWGGNADDVSTMSTRLFAGHSLALTRTWR